MAITALGAFLMNAEVLYQACWALLVIADNGRADAIAAIRAVDGVMDKLRQASGVMRAFRWDDSDNSAARVLAQLG